MTSKFIIEFISAIVGTLGFAILFKVRPKYFALTSILGGLAYCVYYLTAAIITSAAGSFIASLLATIFVAIAAEICARILRSPALVFLSPGLIPIVPGSALYNTMKHIITREGDMAMYYGMEALKIALGIAGGIVVVSVLVSVYNSIYAKIKSRKKYKL